jgi:NAD+ synthase (glutamine-hydrolysing)
MSVIPKHSVTPLSSELQDKVAEIRGKRNFNAEEWIECRTNQLLEYLKKYKLKACVLSVSGGVDSGCVAGLLKRAQEKASKIHDHPFNPANGGRIVCVAQPFNSTESVQNRAYEVGTAFGLEIWNVDRSEEFNSSMSKVEAAIGGELKGFAKAMCKSYERTPINYLLASHFGGVVMGTGNKDEDGYLYYYCKFGDGAVDVGLIWDLHKSEVYQVGSALGVPQSILSAPPTADLSPGQTDEEEIGATYDSVELVTCYVHMSPGDRIALTSSLSEESYSQFDREFWLIEDIHRKGIHKADLNPKNLGSSWYDENISNAKSDGDSGDKTGSDTNKSAIMTSATTELTKVSLSFAEVTSIVQFLKWSEEKRRKFMTHFETHMDERVDFEKKVEFVKAIRDL